MDTRVFVLEEMWPGVTCLQAGLCLCLCLCLCLANMVLEKMWPGVTCLQAGRSRATGSDSLSELGASEMCPIHNPIKDRIINIFSCFEKFKTFDTLANYS